MTILEALKQTVTSIKTWADGKFLKKADTTADDFGIYVQDTEPTNAVAGDIWIDTLSDPSYTHQTFIETDPTVPDWAKASVKPTYTKSEVGLGNVDNVKQYSASNPPPYPVTSVNGKTGAITIDKLPSVTTADNGKVLMVVDGAWKVVSITMTIDGDGVVSV